MKINRTVEAGVCLDWILVWKQCVFSLDFMRSKLFVRGNMGTKSEKGKNILVLVSIEAHLDVVKCIFFFLDFVFLAY